MTTPTLGRRAFLACAAGVGALGVVGYGHHTARQDVAIWFSEAAAEYPDLPDRTLGLLEPALDEAGVDATVDVRSRPIPLEEEQGERLMTVTWPRLAVGGMLHAGPVQPAGSVNLLVTDGDPRSEPAGYGMRGIAAVTGARYLAALPEAIRETAVVDYAPRAAVAQLLLHECGHAMGLGHRHGEVTVREGATVASPMVGSYAWAAADVRRRHIGHDANVCGRSLARGEADRKKLSLRYGGCARRSVGRTGW